MLKLAYQKGLLPTLLGGLGTGSYYKTDIMVRYPNGWHTLIIVEIENKPKPKNYAVLWYNVGGSAYYGAYDLTIVEAIAEADRRAKKYQRMVLDYPSEIRREFFKD